MYPEPNKPEFQPFTPTYSPVDTAYAWISLVAAFLFCQSLPVASYPLGGFLLIGSLFLSAFVILRIKKSQALPRLQLQRPFLSGDRFRSAADQHGIFNKPFLCLQPCKLLLFSLRSLWQPH